MKKISAILLMLAMIFTMAACGSSEAEDDAQQNEVNTDSLTESAQMVLRMEDGMELVQGDLLNVRDIGNSNLEVLYGGEVVTGYELLIEGEPCVSAVMWEEDNFRLGAVKNGTCELVIVYGEEKLTHPLFVEGMPEVLALNWIGYIIYGAGEDGDGVFGTTMFDDDVTVLFNGEAIADYTFTVLDESLAEVTKNADGSLHIKALKQGEAVEFLTIEYGDASALFGLCTE